MTPATDLLVLRPHQNVHHVRKPNREAAVLADAQDARDELLCDLGGVDLLAWCEAVVASATRQSRAPVITLVLLAEVAQ